MGKSLDGFVVGSAIGRSRNYDDYLAFGFADDSS